MGKHGVKVSIGILTLIFPLFQVCAGGTVQGADPIDFSKSMARMGIGIIGGSVEAAAAPTQSFTYRSSAQTWSTSTLSFTIQLTSVAAGDLIVLYIGWSTGSDTTSSSTVSDGGSTFTSTAVNHVNSVSSNFAYTLAAVTTGTVNYTVTAPTGALYIGVEAMRFSVGTTPQYDTKASKGGNLGSNPAVITSDAITVAGSPGLVVVGTYANGRTSITAGNINGSAADQSVVETAHYSSAMEESVLATGASNVTGSFSHNTPGDYLIEIIAFK